MESGNKRPIKKDVVGPSWWWAAVSPVFKPPWIWPIRATWSRWWKSKSAIGGVMAQLDKTFPTNDCSMCIISPKLVEAGRHLNIDLFTTTEVEKVEGEAGNFKVTLLQKPRYIELDKCTACGECAKVCPINVPNKFDEGLRDRKAAFKLYPQGMPSAYAIEKRGTAPCKATCPAHVSIQGYIALINDGRYKEALKLFKQDHPFPACAAACATIPAKAVHPQRRGSTAGHP
jgi:ferredoxin